MTSSELYFFSPQDNVPADVRPKAANISAPAGYISPSGKLVLPAKTIQQLGIDPALTRFRVGVRAGKRRIDHLYLVPLTGTEPGTFALQAGAKSQFINLASPLRASGLDYTRVKYRFTISPVEVGQQPAYALALTGVALKQRATPRAPYMGKPRGRKKKGLA